MSKLLKILSIGVTLTSCGVTMAAVRIHEKPKYQAYPLPCLYCKSLGKNKCHFHSIIKCERCGHRHSIGKCTIPLEIGDAIAVYCRPCLRYMRGESCIKHGYTCKNAILCTVCKKVHLGEYCPNHPWIKRVANVWCKVCKKYKKGNHCTMHPDGTLSKAVWCQKCRRFYRNDLCPICERRKKDIKESKTNPCLKRVNYQRVRPPDPSIHRSPDPSIHRSPDPSIQPFLRREDYHYILQVAESLYAHRKAVWCESCRSFHIGDHCPMRPEVKLNDNNDNPDDPFKNDW